MTLGIYLFVFLLVYLWYIFIKGALLLYAKIKVSLILLAVSCSPYYM